MTVDQNHPHLDVCLVALHALPAIRPKLDQSVGGTETRAWMFARGLAARDDMSVRMVVRGAKGLSPFGESGVQVLPRYDRLYTLYESVGHSVQRLPRFPWLVCHRFRPSLLWQIPLLGALRLAPGSKRRPAQPDAFYQQIASRVFCTFGVQSNSARVIASAHAVGRPAVLMVGSDGDLDERYRPDSDYVSQYGDQAPVCSWILQQADAIVVQTERQQQMLKDRFGREGHRIANPIDLEDWHRRTGTPLPAAVCAGLDRYVLWVGRAEPLHKRPQLLPEIARRCPEVDFLMVLNPRDEQTRQNVISSRPDNLHVVPNVPFDLMPALFARAAAFVSTSALEGFPNVFLQAAASGVPIASLEVGGEFLAASGSGRSFDDNIDPLVDFLRLCWSNPAMVPMVDMDYLASHHGLSQQADRLRAVLQDVVATTSPPAGN